MVLAGVSPQVHGDLAAPPQLGLWSLHGHKHGQQPRKDTGPGGVGCRLVSLGLQELEGCWGHHVQGQRWMGKGPGKAGCWE